MSALKDRLTDRPTLRWTSWAAAFAAGWIGFGTAGQTYDFSLLGEIRFFIGLAAGVPLALAVVRPFLGLALAVAGAAGFAVTLPLRPELVWNFTVIHGLVIFVLLFATGATERFRVTVLGWLLTATLFGWAVKPELRAGWIVGITVIAVLGLLVHRLTATSRALAAQTELAVTEKAHRVLLEERARIARDLHDIVAHHMSLVVVQAQTAAYRVPDLSDAARAELESISETARSALAQTRSLLTVLRNEGDAAEHAPQPGLEGLDELVGAARRAGMAVETDLHADDPDLPLDEGVSLAGYRIVQEALANARRHAPGSTVRVTRRLGADGVRLRVENGPGGRTPGPEGHGLTGIRERAAAAGAQVSLGPTPTGGFAVDVVLPAPIRQHEAS